MKKEVAVPQQHERPIRELVSLTKDEREFLLKTLQNPPPEGPAKIEEALSSLQTGSRRIPEVLSVLASLYKMFVDWGLDAKEFAEIVVRAIERLDPAPTIRDRAEITRFFSRIGELQGSFGLYLKAKDVRSDHQHVWCHARILTDIRPIFALDESTRIEAAAVIHTLKIHFRSRADDGEFFIALETRDLLELRELVDRALAKEEQITKKLGNAIQFLPEVV
jgi:hypothetical protein